MKKVISALSLIAALAIYGAAQLYQQVPKPIGNSVIAEQGDGARVATLLPSSMTDKQHELLNMAYEVGVEAKLKSPEILQAVLLQETGAGAATSYNVANPGPNAYFGPMQIKLVAAKAVLQRWPAMFTEYGFHTKTDDEIKANLILNERFNMHVAAMYLTILSRDYGFKGRELLNAYNRGPAGVKEVGTDYHYAIGAQRKLAVAMKRS
jgi:hypothetical protein